jgi:hypothetical protein
MIFGNLGIARLLSGQMTPAAEAFREMLRLCAPHAFARYAPEGVAGIAAIAVCEGHCPTAARLRGAARAMGYPDSATSTQIDERLEREYFAPARTRHGTAAWQQGEDAGAALSYDEVIVLAIEASRLAGARLLKLAATLEPAHAQQTAADRLGAGI